ncbi:MAG TPA: hypothetical protein VGB85_05315, partial [Nannocystis sp.]
MSIRGRVTSLLCLALAACGDSGGATDGATAGASTTITTAATMPTASDPSGAVPTTGEGGSQSASEGATTEATSTTGATGTSDSTSGGDEGPKLDLGVPDGGAACGCEFSYVWVANSEESTVSKINMETLKEEGRYLTRADGIGNPSRTSVALNGDVAVANRHGGLVKFHADVGDCVERNGKPGIQTSSGKDDVLAWEDEECRAWYLDFPTSNQRPVAWTQGTVTPGTCDTTGEKVWTVMSEK